VRRQLLQLPALDVAELHRDALHRLGVLAFDLLLELAVASPQPLGQLVQRRPPLGRVLLEVERCRLRHLLGALREVLAELPDQHAVLLEARVVPLGLRLDPCRDLRRELLLALREPRDLGGEALLELREVASPLRQPLLDARLRRRQRLDQLHTGVALVLGDLAPPCVGDAPLLFRERRHRLGPRHRQRALELGRAALGLPRDDLVERRLAALDLPLERARPGTCPPDQHHGGGRRATRDDGGGDRDCGCCGHGA
jgi:hypothetical protein